ncbi:kinase-like domain-containing protein [Flammula alnicola]|nr:kinase-like domain-containing protein [Flammula alnicola]
MDMFLKYINPPSEIKGAAHFHTSGIISNTSGHAGLVLISGERLVKFGKAVSMEEAAEMEYARQNTRIPVPKVPYAFRHGPYNWGYIVMDFIKAETLDNAQFSLSEDQLLMIARQLNDFVGQLREIGSNQATFMGSWPSGSFRNIYFHGSPPPQEFRTMDEFREYWLERVPKGDRDAPPLDHTAVVNKQIVLTHGDLSPRNILIKDSVIVAILDWETLGWYPIFWEYTFADRGAWYGKWAKALASALGPMTNEGNYYGYLINDAIQTSY